MTTNRFYKDGKLVDEKVEASGLLRFLYTSRIGSIFLWPLKLRWFSKLCRLFQNSSFSKRKIAPFIKKHSIRMGDFIVPERGFRSFNHFFIRKLKEKARSIDHRDEIVVSPADSNLLAIRQLTHETTFFVKSRPFSLKKFFGHGQDGAGVPENYLGGTMLIFRLAPYHYHRYHFPFDCEVVASRRISGCFDSVNPLVYKSGKMPLIENERVLNFLQTKRFGLVTVAAVGALAVGKISQGFAIGQSYKKGDEMGYFSFGGSSIVLLFEKKRVRVDKTILAHSAQNFETSVLVGEGVCCESLSVSDIE